MPSTHEQNIAKSADRHLAVTANAGSGKTSVLVERYVNIALSGADIRSIVAITFTKKAASEMLNRVAISLEKLLADVNEQKNWDKIKAIRERLSGARVSTIHSFCARLLRDYPIEADVNPNFTELSEADGIRLREQSIIATMETWLEADDERCTIMQEILRLFGRAKVESFLDQLLANAENLYELQQLYAEWSDEELVAQAHKKYVSDLLENEKKYVELMESAAAYCTNITEKYAEKLDAAMTALRKIRFILGMHIENPTAEDALGAADFIQESFDEIIKKDGSLGSKIASGDSDTRRSKLFALKMKQSYAKFSNAKEIWEHAKYDADVVRHSRTLLRIALDVMNAIEEEKERTGALNFDDLQLKAAELLNNKTVLEKLRISIRFLMVDEFQDTNELQYAIVRKLTHALSAEALPGEESTNLFIVGDAKQSIYGFRGADVRVFGVAQKDIAFANQKAAESGLLSQFFSTPEGKIAPRTQEERDGIIRLSASFRLLPVIAAFVNQVCGKTMAEQESDFDVEYEPLVCGRQTDALAEERGSVSLVLGIYNVGNAENPKEAELLAQKLQAMVEGRTAQVWEWNKESGGEVSRPARWSDIAVLSRARAGFDVLADEFRKLKIPFVISSGRGFYERQEILDIRSFLQFLQNPDDDSALAAIFRSPFLAIDDEILVNISVQTGATLWEKSLVYCEEVARQNAAHYERYISAIRLLKEILPLSARLTIPSLLRMILEKTAWRAVISADERREQMEANMEKLLDFAREFEDKGFKNLFDFVEELRILSEISTNEGEADIATGRNAVTLMTIHASKGLEFPIVALYQTNSSKSVAHSLYADTHFGIAFKPPIATETGIFDEVETPLLRVASAHSRLAESAEQKRLLYVALTRAKDHLIISGTIKKGKNGVYNKVQGFLKMILDGMDLEVNEAETRITKQYTQDIQVLHHGNQEKSEFGYTVLLERDFYTEFQRIEVSGEQCQIIEWENLTGALSAHLQGEFFSASQLMLFQKNPDEFERVYRLGLPHRDDSFLLGATATPEDEADDVIGTFAGTAIHAVLSRLPQLLEVQGAEQARRLEDIVGRELAILEKPASAELRERIMRESMAVLQTPLLKKIGIKPQESRFEHPFTMPIGADFLHGVVDALVKLQNGLVEIWDWKTNQCQSADDADRLFESYKIQLETYLYFLATAHSEASEFTARLLFTRMANAESADDVWTRTLTLTREEIPAVEAKIMGIISEIRARTY